MAYSDQSRTLASSACEHAMSTSKVERACCTCPRSDSVLLWRSDSLAISCSRRLCSSRSPATVACRMSISWPSSARNWSPRSCNFCCCVASASSMARSTIALSFSLKLGTNSAASLSISLSAKLFCTSASTDSNLSCCSLRRASTCSCTKSFIEEAAEKPSSVLEVIMLVFVDILREAFATSGGLTFLLSASSFGSVVGALKLPARTTFLARAGSGDLFMPLSAVTSGSLGDEKNSALGLALDCESSPSTSAAEGLKAIPFCPCKFG
mmetsp:Transcript_13291/g.30270  ORF Transcript_13291/g.30270 Transcript_13291/m.30270 type:complete len:267 (+) Transcript_13291:582-1382(+)